MGGQGEERRQHLRRAIELRGLVILADQQIGCTVQDISDVGAMLFLDEMTELPEEFGLEIPGNAPVTRRCRPIRRNGKVIGVHFINRNERRPAK